MSILWYTLNIILFILWTKMTIPPTTSSLSSLLREEPVNLILQNRHTHTHTARKDRTWRQTLQTQTHRSASDQTHSGCQNFHQLKNKKRSGIPPLRKLCLVDVNRKRKCYEKEGKEEKEMKAGLTLTSAFLLSRLLAAVDGETVSANISTLGWEQQSTLPER